MVLINSCELELFNGNTHGHYIKELVDSERILYVYPPKAVTFLNIFKLLGSQVISVKKNLFTFQYYNIFPSKLSLFQKLNDHLNEIVIRLKSPFKIKKQISFHPSYLVYAFQGIEKIFFPLDGYAMTKSHIDTLELNNQYITVNSIMAEFYQKSYNKSFQVIPHGIPTKSNKIKEENSCDILFVGTISQGVDLNLIFKIVETFSEYSVRIIGPLQVELSETWKSILRASNVEYIPGLPYHEIHGHIKTCKLGIVAYHFGKDNVWRNPIKITDFIAHQKPIVSSVVHPDLFNLEDIGVVLKGDINSYLKAIEDILENGWKFNLVRWESYCKENSYSQLIKRLNLIKE